MKNGTILATMLFFCFLFATNAFAEDEIQVESKVNKYDTDELFTEDKTYNEKEVIVKFKASTDAEDRKNFLANYSAKEKEYSEAGGFSLVSVSSSIELQDLADKMLKSSLVEFVEPNYVVESAYVPSDTLYSKQWYLQKVNAEQAWNTTKGSSDVVVAVVDGGVEVTHSDLASNLLTPYNVLTTGTTVSADEHGTHVAGIIAATLNDKGTVGIAPNVKILPINVFKGDSADVYDVATGITYAADHGANIINLSLGTYDYSYVVDYAAKYAYSKGVLLVAAAGNESVSMPSYPAALDSVISVSATNSRDVLSYFSNYGSTIDISAPGENIVSTVNGGSYESLSGTSMASPVVSGVAALMLSKNPFLTPSELTSILYQSSKDLGKKGKDSSYGNGRVDAQQAVSSTPSALSAITLKNSTYTMTGSNNLAFTFEPYTSIVSVNILDANKNIIRHLVKNKKVTTRKYNPVWDGKNDSGVYVSNGTYTIQIEATNGTKTVKQTKTIKVVNKVTPTINVTTSSTVYYSPNVKAATSVTFVLNKKANVTAKITDSKGKTVQTLWSNKLLYGGKRTVTWNGTNSYKQKVADGTYKLVLSAKDNYQLVSKQQTNQIILDTKLPTVSESLNQSIVKLSGANPFKSKITLSEAGTMYVAIKSENGTTVKQFFTNKAFNAGATSVSWDRTNNNNEAVATGNYRFYYIVKDKSGNMAKINGELFAVAN